MVGACSPVHRGSGAACRGEGSAGFFDTEELKVSVPQYITATRLAKRLDLVDARTVRDRVRRGEFGDGVVVIGGELRIPLAAVEAWLAARRFSMLGEISRPEEQRAGLRRGRAARG